MIRNFTYYSNFLFVFVILKSMCVQLKMCSLIKTMAIPVVEFSREGYKIRKVFASESTCPKEMIEF